MLDLHTELDDAARGDIRRPLDSALAKVARRSAGSKGQAEAPPAPNNERIEHENKTGPHVQIKLIPEHTHVNPGETLKVAIDQTIQAGWHTYWLNPGDSGQKMTVEWRGKPVWIVHRTKEELDALPKHDDELADPKSERKTYPIPENCKNEWRSIKPEILVLIGICTHLGCSPSDKFQPGAQPSLPDDWPGGWLCPCHGSTFDLAGRVFKNKPAPDNLEVPPYKFLSDTRLLIGEENKA